MSEEEKKAINQLKADTNFYDYEIKNGNYIYDLFKIEVYKKDVDVVLNLIDRLQKELEQEKEKHKSTIYNFELAVDKLENSISKEKIKEELERAKEVLENLDNEQDILVQKIVIIHLENLFEDLLKEN